jgi:hypothetical protein
MGILFGDASTPGYVGTVVFRVGLLAGFLAVIAACVVVDEVANAVYRRGYAKPFFYRGHRIHHFWIYLIIPSSYAIIVALILTGHVHLITNMFQYRLAFLVPVVALCIAVDFLGDGMRTGLRAIRGHEWIYVLVPLYVVEFVLNVYV